jgi:hypothetical protein
VPLVAALAVGVPAEAPEAAAVRAAAVVALPVQVVVLVAEPSAPTKA